jgi:hypothetical protein
LFFFKNVLYYNGGLFGINYFDTPIYSPTNTVKTIQGVQQKNPILKRRFLCENLFKNGQIFFKNAFYISQRQSNWLYFL